MTHPPCACGGPHYAKGLCRPCYRRQMEPPSGLSVAVRGPAIPPLVRCACGRAAHPATGTCLRCGGGWPQLDRPDGRAVGA